MCVGCGGCRAYAQGITSLIFPGIPRHTRRPIRMADEMVTIKTYTDNLIDTLNDLFPDVKSYRGTVKTGELVDQFAIRPVRVVSDGRTLNVTYNMESRIAIERADDTLAHIATFFGRYFETTGGLHISRTPEAVVTQEHPEPFPDEADWSVFVTAWVATLPLQPVIERVKPGTLDKVIVRLNDWEPRWIVRDRDGDIPD